MRIGKAFLMVMLPAVKTGIITIMVISFLNGWNDLVYSMTFNVAETMRPLTANIYKFQSAYGTRWNCIMAYGAILVLPVIADAAEFTIWLPTSNTAITMSKVLLRSMTAIHAFIKKRIKIAVLKSCRLFLSITME